MPIRQTRRASSAARLLACAAALAAGAAAADQPAPTAQQQAESLAREAEQRFNDDDLAGALRAYERACFWLAGPLGLPADGAVAGGGSGPGISEAPLPDWLEEIVPLAISLNRVDEAIRYAVLLPAPSVDDPPTLRKLALLARERAQWSDAARLQERWLNGSQGPRQGLERLLGELEVGRLRYLADDAEGASRAFASVQRTLADPQTPRRVEQRLTAALGGSLATTWEVFGQAHYEAGHLDKAAAAFAQVPRSSHDSPSLRYWRARLALARRRPLEAYELLLGGGSAGPLEREAYALIDDFHASLNQPQRAIDEYRRIVDERPADTTAAVRLGLKLSDAGREREAEQTLERVVQRTLAARRADPLLLSDADGAEPGDDAAIEAADWLFGRYAATGRGDAFLRLAGDAFELLGTLGYFEEGIGAALAEHGGFAETLFARLEMLPGPRALPLTATAELAAAGGRRKIVAAAYRRAIAEADDPDQRRRFALAWWGAMMFLDDNDAATDALQEAIDKALWAEDAHDPHYHMAASLALGDRPAAAVDAARRAAQLAPDNLAVRERLAWTLLRADRGAEAIDAYADLIKAFDDRADPGSRATLRLARLSLSQLTDDAGEHGQGAELALQVLDEFPDDAGALNDLAYLWTKQGRRLERAQRMARRAVQLAPDNYAYRDSLGWAQHRLGDHTAALESIRRAIQLQEGLGEPPDGEVLDHLGDVLAALDRAPEALAAWRRAAEAFDGGGEAERAATIRKKGPAPAADPPSSADEARL